MTTFAVDLKYKHFKTSAMVVNIFECSIMKDELRNFVSSFISGEKY